MFAPTASITPTRLPTLWWTLAAALLLLSVFAPAFASQPPAHDETSPALASGADRPADGSTTNLRGLHE